MRVNAQLAQVFAQRFLERETAMVRANRDGDFSSGIAGGGSGLGLFQKIQHGENALFDLVAGVAIRLKRAPDGVADVLFVFIKRVVKLAHKKCFFRSLGKEQAHGIHMAVRHSEDVIGLGNQLGREHAAALGGNLNAQLFERVNGMQAGRLAIHRADASGQDLIAAARRVAEEPLGHRAAANVAGANE